MFKIAVGDKIKEFIKNDEGAVFDMADDGGILIIFFNNPTVQEIEQIRYGNLRFGMFTKENIIFILVKFGTLEWIDCPYHVKLSQNLTNIYDIEHGQGYGLAIIFANSLNGEVKALRQVGLGHEYSKRLKENIEEQQEEKFNIVEYDKKLNEIMNTYCTRDMVNYSEIDCQI